MYLWLLARRVPAGSQRPATGSLGYLASGLVLPAGDVAAATDLDVAVAVIAVTTAAAALTGMTERVLAATLPPHRLPTRRQWAAVVGPAAVAPVATLAYAPAVWAPSTLVVATLGIVALLLARLLADAHIHQHAAAQAEERSTVDALTGLPNRAAALEEIDGRLAGGDGVAVIFCDLDGFKGVNDLFGHAAGDSILVEVAARLRSVDGAWSVARHSGDEFLAVCDPADVDAVGQRLRAAVSAPYQIDVISRATLTPSLGAAASCDLSDDPRAVTAAEIVDAGDKAMYEAKRAGKDQLIRHGTRVRAANLATDLREAMLAGEVGVRYEPVLASDTMRPVRFEARPQWRHPVGGNIEPTTTGSGRRWPRCSSPRRWPTARRGGPPTRRWACPSTSAHANCSMPRSWATSR